jgi:4-hydroxybutyrate CoA-transferase
MKKTRSPKVVTAEQAVEAIRDNDDVVLSNFCSEPIKLPMALMERAPELSGVRLYHMAIHGPFQEKYLEPGMEKHVRCATTLSGRSKVVRQLIAEGRADFYSVTFYGVPHLLREGDIKSDVFMATLAPPDDFGYCNLGINVDYAWGVLERPPRLIMAEFNPHMPRTHGRTALHISEIDYVVEVDEPLFELQQFPITDVETRIGQYVASLVEDGSTLQIGYGGMSEACIYFLKDKKDLGLHTEMVPDGARELIELGVINNSKKSMHKGLITCAFNGGTKKLYDWLENNPLIEMHPVDYTNDPKVIAQNSKMVAINSALQVDLFGNIYADQLGLQDQYSGAGGQLDFAIGCSIATNAKFINVLPSTTGEFSRIVVHPSLEKENQMSSRIATVTRYYADYVITEFGVARLKGRSNRERATQLINIAHPDHRGRLQQQAKKLGLL